MLKLLLPVALAGCVAAPQSSVGETQGAIVGGTTDSGDPNVVLLIAYDPNNQNAGYSMCTGEVISPHVVLTAAHCVDPATVGQGMGFVIFLGSDFNNSTQANDQNNYVGVKETHYDTSFSPNNLQGGHDVGIAITSTAINVTPLPYNQSAVPQSLVGSTMTIIGYGISSGTDTNGTTAGTKRKTTLTNWDFDDLFIYLMDTRHETCEGDSGGPALVTINGVPTIIGTTSFGDQGCTQGGVDTNVATYTSFIDPFVQADTGSTTSNPDMSQPQQNNNPDMTQTNWGNNNPDMAQTNWGNNNPDLSQPSNNNGGNQNPDLAEAPQGSGSRPTGSLCHNDSDCKSGLCAVGGYCTQSCTPGVAGSCPSGYTCGGVQGHTYCERALGGGGSNAAGCSVGGAAQTGSGMFIVALALVGLALSRRRPR